MDIKDKVAKTFFDTTTTEAQNKCVCISCKKPIHLSDQPTNTEGNIYSTSGAKEYQITGMCEYCFDQMVKEMEEE